MGDEKKKEERYKIKLYGDIKPNYSLNLIMNVPEVWLNENPTIIVVSSTKVSGALCTTESVTSQSRQENNVLSPCHVAQ